MGSVHEPNNNTDKSPYVEPSTSREKNWKFTDLASELAVDPEGEEISSEDVWNTVTTTNNINTDEDDSVQEFGRTYHRYKQGSYLLPNDAKEKARLTVQHHMTLYAMDGELYLAPIAEPKNVLDIGTGTGIWAIEMASRHPESNVLGVDLSPVKTEAVPSNCQFEIADVTDPWSYDTQFDFIHGRFLLTCFDDHKAVFRAAYENLAPGGYLELEDIGGFEFIDDSGDGTALKKWNDTLFKAGLSMGRNWKCAWSYAQWLQELGFVDVVEKHYVCPGNTWPKGKYFKTLGILLNQNVKLGFEGLSMAVMTRGLRMSEDEVMKLVAEAKPDLDDKNIHSYSRIIVVHARKPL
ncbi:putative methyltransferase domain-containing protein [Phaeomoniella chlamydospora]|uniref:Putative methyltransferase domain-containing protein n=1 Tax=Phaeomoniella chlamydospora TaxID=158046 RepID=A0A0G2EG93_PHACM|nr:putative methyltransferase domain-containing protein [Phaeomoniella chlamydospora]